jgi:hypothetical protein
MSAKQNQNTKSNTITAQEKIAKDYRDKGWEVSQPHGTADLKCNKGNVTHFVKVDKSDKPNKSDLNTKNVGVLKMTATKNNATSVIAKVDKDGNSKITYAKTGSKVKQ